MQAVLYLWHAANVPGDGEHGRVAHVDDGRWTESWMNMKWNPSENY